MKHLILWLMAPSGFLTVLSLLFVVFISPHLLKFKYGFKIHRITGFVTISSGILHAIVTIYIKYFMS
jgi:membrane protein YdbS with pleckstrin-like domain